MDGSFVRVELSFDPPADPGELGVDEFDASCQIRGVDQSLVEAVGESSPLTVTGLLPDREYLCSVAAVDPRGAFGPDADVAITVTGPRRPGAPRNLRARPAPAGLLDGSFVRVELSFDPPADPGELGVDEFDASCQIRGVDQSLVEAVGESSPLTVTGLLPDREYLCSVAAVDPRGAFGPDADVAITVTGPRRLGAPRNLRARPAPAGLLDGSFVRVELSFDPPADPGELGVDEFDASCQIRGVDQSLVEAVGESSPLTVTGLLPDREYLCSVAAVDPRGAFGPDADVAITVTGPRRPGAPRNLRARPAPAGLLDGSFVRVELSFDPPADPGELGVDEFDASCQIRGVDQSLVEAVGESSPLTVTGLLPDREYLCSVAAVDPRGAFGPDADINVNIGGPGAPRQQGVPSAPRNVKAGALALRGERQPRRRRARGADIRPTGGPGWFARR